MIWHDVRWCQSSNPVLTPSAFGRGCTARRRTSLASGLTAIVYISVFSVSYHRTIRFADTDAAGVVYFAALLSICHEAYEDALAKSGVDLARFFRGEITSGQTNPSQPVIIPISHAEIDFRRPLHCGEEITIELFWQAETEHDQTQEISEFAIVYTIIHNHSARVVGRAMTRHVCVNRLTHQRMAIPLELERCMSQA